MAGGKQTCRILKEIRRQIAEANGIEFVTSECRYRGDCLGTCPKCEAEVQYLEQQLRARSLTGKAVALAGISAGMILMSGCTIPSSTQSSKTSQDEPVESTEQIEEPEFFRTHGEVIVIEDSDPDPSKIYSIVDQYPEFPGGEEALMNFIAQHLRYPEDELNGCIQGRVTVRFYVDTLGRVCEPEVEIGKDPALDREALRVVQSFPDFTPGTIKGTKVNTYMVLPISFKLPTD